jgi:hypothetical protein
MYIDQVVVHTCNPSYSRGRYPEVRDLKLTLGKKISETLPQKKKKKAGCSGALL